MNVKTIVIASFASAMLAGCAGFSGSTATGARPMGVSSTSPGAASKEPESANSLPPGDSVAGPVTSNVGTVGTARY
ncbi:MAG: hypothetical protein ACRYG8_32500 [Janthinobacterium lividum]